MRTFGDSTKTPGQHINDRCYILAQFPETSNFDWARDLRAYLGGGELKYEKYLALRHKVQANKQLWKHVQDGTAEATIVVIENSFYIGAIAYRLKKEGADLGHDVSLADLLRQAALSMIDHAPVMRLQDLPYDLGAGAAVAGRYSSEDVLKNLGGKFNDAAVFAARAQAVFDLEELETSATTNELFYGPYRSRKLFDFSKTERVFDKEHPKSAMMLNQMLLSYDGLSNNLSRTYVQEDLSESHDALQAADFCAGFASEVMMNSAVSKERALRQYFRRVIYNGATR